jgi:hypothetical protein
MANIIEEGCVQTCSHCKTKFSFVPSEVRVAKVNIPPGYSPEEEGYKKSVFTVSCPKCHAQADVGAVLGPDGKRFAEARAQQVSAHEDYDL